MFYAQTNNLLGETMPPDLVTDLLKFAFIILCFITACYAIGTRGWRPLAIIPVLAGLFTFLMMGHP